MASRGVNKVILIGRLGQDPECKQMPSGDTVTNASLATSESWKDQQGQQQERTEWHKLTFYKRLAEIAGEYLRKGSKVYIEGRLQTRKWQDQNGQDRYTTEIIVSTMQMLDSKGDNQQPQQAPQQRQQAPQQQPQQQRQPQQQQQNAYAQQSQGMRRPQQQQPQQLDDHIPF